MTFSASADTRRPPSAAWAHDGHTTPPPAGEKVFPSGSIPAPHSRQRVSSGRKPIASSRWSSNQRATTSRETASPASSAESAWASSRNASCESAAPSTKRSTSSTTYQAAAVECRSLRSPRWGSSSDDEVTTSNVRPTASTSWTSLNGWSPPPMRERGRRTPLAMTLSLPNRGVRTLSTRSASPSSIVRSTIASVL